MDPKDEKLAEARFFLERLRNAETREAFRYCLSAFLSAARSVMQYAHRAIFGERPQVHCDGCQCPPSVAAPAQNQPARQWYNDHMRRHFVLGYFKDKRDLNIHEAPVRAREEHRVALEPVAVSISSSLHIAIHHDDGRVEAFEVPPSPPPSPPPPGPSTLSVHYYFTDWDGEDVLEISQHYLDTLAEVLADGRARGFVA
jgi:hypothetical protein